MKIIGLIFLFLLHNLVSFGQSLSSKEMGFLRQVLPATCLHNRIVYCNPIDKNEIDGLLRSVKSRLINDTIHAKFSSSDCTLILTPKEKKLILQQVSNMRRPFSTNDLLDSAIVISSEELTNFFNTYMDDGWTKFYQKYYPSETNTIKASGYYEFSRPIFIRQSLCLFYWAQVCSLSDGEGHLTFYRLINNQWKKWFDIYDWES